jgi:hypothetical protein
VEASSAGAGDERLGSSDLMEQACERQNLQAALKRVRRNAGSAGIDGMTVEQLPDVAQHGVGDKLFMKLAVPKTRRLTSTYRTARCGPACRVVWQGTRSYKCRSKAGCTRRNWRAIPSRRDARDVRPLSRLREPASPRGEIWGWRIQFFNEGRDSRGEQRRSNVGDVSFALGRDGLTARVPSGHLLERRG